MQRVVLIVGVRGRLHEDGGAVELTQHQSERDGAVFEIDRAHPQLCRRQRREDHRHHDDEACALQIHCLSSG
jgi:hypothetical protein